MSFGDQAEEIVEGGSDDEGVAEDGGLLLGVVESVHEEEDLELSHGVAWDVADGGGDGEEDVDEDGVGLHGEDGVVVAVVARAVVFVGAGAVRAVDHHHWNRIYNDLIWLRFYEGLM